MLRIVQCGEMWLKLIVCRFSQLRVPSVTRTQSGFHGNWRAISTTRILSEFVCMCMCLYVYVCGVCIFVFVCVTCMCVCIVCICIMHNLHSYFFPHIMALLISTASYSCDWCFEVFLTTGSDHRQQGLYT